jgi:hypothetical protein
MSARISKADRNESLTLRHRTGSRSVHRPTRSSTSQTVGPYLNGPRPDADDQSEDRNNARLIAAAPELRDALAALARAIGRIDGYEDILMDPENAARALLTRLGVTL